MEPKKFSNRLSDQSSPYLLQHAHNPVDWHPWGEEALQKALDQHKPILVSIGYAACHWCHVMERESFEDEATAALMNEHFINIKIDREERPDLDHIYMDAVQAMTGSGGWPLNVFLTPEKKPFYGGTYFPPVRAFNRMSWKEVLLAVHDAWLNRREEITRQADTLTEHIAQSGAVFFQAGVQDMQPEDLGTIASALQAAGDKEWGGFGNAPKFPQTFSIQFLLRHAHYTRDEAARAQALLSLDKMMSGGIYDHLAGGFARYSTDEKWLAPHFEKMLYDNALLVSVLSEAYQLTGKKQYADCIGETVSFLQDEMMHPDGGFYSAYDADSEGVEGKYYTWSKKEIAELLGPDAALFCELFDVRENGNWEHTNILWRPTDPAAVAAKHNLDVAGMETRIAACKKILLEARTDRIKPGLDDKILLGWNALMVTALSKAAAALGDEGMRNAAAATLAFLEKNLCSAGTWFHGFHEKQKTDPGVPRQPAFLDDLAYLVQAYLSLQEVTGETHLLDKAKALTEEIMAAFGDEQEAYFYFTPAGQQDMIARKKELYDGAVPSPNAIMAFNLDYLSVVFDLPAWKERAVQMVSGLKNAVLKYPVSFGNWAALYQAMVMGTAEIAVVGPDARERVRQLGQHYIPNRVLMMTETGNDTFTLLKDKFHPGDTLLYLCKQYTCKQPVGSVEQLVKLLTD